MAGFDLSDIPLPAVFPPDLNAGDALCIVTWILTAVSTALIFGRVVSKLFVLKRVAGDDALMLLSWVSPLHLRCGQPRLLMS